LNPNGNHPVIPLRPDGTRDVDTNWKLIDTWKQMESLVRKGKAKAIGGSNFSQKKLEEILPTATIMPAVDQV
jgi:glycerol 2-dehydrogenase (NADP+)